LFYGYVKRQSTTFSSV